MIAGRKEEISKKFSLHEHYLLCKHCGKKGKYDLGLILIDPEKMQKIMQKEQSGKSPSRVPGYIQTTGYIRCKHCNGAGKWGTTSPFFLLAITGVLTGLYNKDYYMIGKNVLADGYVPQWPSDAEGHWLDKLEDKRKEQTELALIWDKLGNTYYSGGRPELAAAAHEMALTLDAKQVDSHFSLGNLLHDIGEWELAAWYYRRMMLYAWSYKQLPAKKLRALLSDALRTALLIHLDSGKVIPFLPDKTEIEETADTESNQTHRDEIQLQLNRFDLHTDRLDSFYPLAEMYMEKRRNPLSAGYPQPLNDNRLQSNSVNISRNAPCPGGSGKKYKKCCLPSV